jgi:hypothetical protein
VTLCLLGGQWPLAQHSCQDPAGCTTKALVWGLGPFAPQPPHLLPEGTDLLWANLPHPSQPSQSSNHHQSYHPPGSLHPWVSNRGGEKGSWIPEKLPSAFLLGLRAELSAGQGFGSHTLGAAPRRGSPWGLSNTPQVTLGSHRSSHRKSTGYRFNHRVFLKPHLEVIWNLNHQDRIFFIFKAWKGAWKSYISYGPKISKVILLISINIYDIYI